MRGYEILPVKAAVHVDRLRPLAVALARIDEVLLRFFGELQFFRKKRHLLAAAAFHEAGVFCHAVVVLAEDRFVLINIRIALRDQDTHIGPADGTVHGPHIEVRAAVGSNVRKPSVLLLPVVNVVQIFPRKWRKVKKVRCARKEELCVAGPAVALTGRAVGRDIQMVPLGRPECCLEKSVHERVGGGKVSCPLQIGIHRDRTNLFRIQFDVGLDLGILKTEDREGRSVFVQALGTGVIDFLQRRSHALPGQLDVLLGQIAVFVQNLTEAPDHLLADVRVHTESHLSGDVLPEIE